MTAADVSAAVARKAKRRFADDLPSPLDSLCKDVPENFRPSRRQFLVWGDFLHPTMAPDPNYWFYGQCPLHASVEAASEAPTALFNWKFGVVRCLEGDACHPGKKNATLTSAIERRAGVVAGG